MRHLKLAPREARLLREYLLPLQVCILHLSLHVSMRMRHAATPYRVQYHVHRVDSMLQIRLSTLTMWMRSSRRLLRQFAALFRITHLLPFHNQTAIAFGPVILRHHSSLRRSLRRRVRHVLARSRRATLSLFKLLVRSDGAEWRQQSRFLPLMAADARHVTLFLIATELEANLFLVVGAE